MSDAAEEAEVELRRQLFEARAILDRWRPIVLAARELIGKNVTRPHVYEATDKSKYHLALALAQAGQDLPDEPMGEGAVFCIPHKIYYGRGGICRKCLNEIVPAVTTIPGIVMTPSPDPCAAGHSWFGAQCTICRQFKID